jgi:choline-sulfatase
VPDRRPNVLFVMADQLTASALPFHGGPVDAPHLERLAGEGVVFDSAYCSFPLCAPSRASLLTGRLASALGIYDSGAEFCASFPTVAHHLRDRGYETCLVGKMHFIGPDQLHGFEERLTTDVYTSGLDWIPDWSLPLSERLPWYHDMSSVLEAGPSEATLQLDYDEEVAFRSVRKIYDLARSRERPFFLLVSFTHPHDPYEIPRRYWDRYEGRELPPPAVPALAREQQDAHSLRVLEMCGAGTEEIGPELVERARRGYYASVSYVDDKVAELLEALETTGLRDDTVVVVASDHGDMLGERGLWYKMTFFEDSVRAPLVVHAPHRFPAARVAASVSLLDLLPTLVELADGEGSFAPDDPVDGTSLVPLLEGRTAAHPAVVAEYHAEGTQAPCAMVREGPLKYVHCPTDPDLLFDLDADPLELENLAASPEHAADVQRLRQTVDQRWDLAALERDVVASQKRRLFVSRALAHGAQSPWDHRPPEGPSSRFVRGRDFWEPFGRARLRRES